MIQHCPTCGFRPHSQDDLHGKGRRVFNENKGPKETALVCTVCGHTEHKGSSEPKK